MENGIKLDVPEVLDVQEKLKERFCAAFENVHDLCEETMGMLDTQNSRPTNFWDNLNTELGKKLFDYPNYKRYICNRGPWELVVVYFNGIIFTFMREKRFDEIRKEYAKDSNSRHYVALLAKCFNSDLKLINGSLFYEELPTCDDVIRDDLEKMLKSFDDDGLKIDRHALILFETDSDILLNIRMVVINSRFEIVYQESLNKYIEVAESTTVKKVEDKEQITDPKRKLKFTGKALTRKGDGTKFIDNSDEDFLKDNDGD